MASIRYTGPSGRVMDLTKSGDWYRSIAYGGLVGMVGQVETSTSQAIGVPGQTPTHHQTQDMTGELKLWIYASEGAPTVDDAVSEIRREFVGKKYGTLELMPREGAKWRHTLARLNGFIAPPVAFPEDEVDAEVTVPLISDGGLWTEEATTRQGIVTVTNGGDDFLWPELIITGAGSITLPSDTRYDFPEPGGTRIVSLDPYTSHEAVGEDDAVDEAYSDLTEQMWLAEGVPEDTSRFYSTTGGVAVRWAQQYRDPWR